MSSPGRLTGPSEAPPELRVVNIQRARLVGAMADVVVERGYAGATVADVVARAGVSRRTFYEIFEHLDACFLATFESALARAKAYVTQAYDPLAGWSERMRAGLTALLLFVENEPALGRLLFVESLGAGPEMLRRRSAVLARIAATVDEGRGESRDGGHPSPVIAEGIVGAVVSVVHQRIVDGRRQSLLGLVNGLMSLIVLPYLGAAASQYELGLPPAVRKPRRAPPSNPLWELDMRVTYRTMRVLLSIGSQPGVSNRAVGNAAGIADQGQISKLLARLQRIELIENTGPVRVKGAANAWKLTPRGEAVLHVVERPHLPTASDTGSTGLTRPRERKQ